MKEVSNKAYNKIAGNSAEKIAEDYLKKKGYKILATNYVSSIGEIDIIAKQNKSYIFVEVKFRKNDYFGLPRETVNTYKQQKIRAVASSYIRYNNLYDKPCRFDVIEILGDKITHIENCF